MGEVKDFSDHVDARETKQTAIKAINVASEVVTEANEGHGEPVEKVVVLIKRTNHLQVVTGHNEDRLFASYLHTMGMLHEAALFVAGRPVDPDEV